jgi:ABC-type uncharacterized transport system auxiliary subunit
MKETLSCTAAGSEVGEINTVLSLEIVTFSTDPKLEAETSRVALDASEEENILAEVRAERSFRISARLSPKEGASIAAESY